MARYTVIFLAAAGAFALLLSGCQKRGLQELVREELFSLSLGRMEDQVDLFQIDGASPGRTNKVYMRDGLFYIANGNAGKVMVFSSYGDLIFLMYNPTTNPVPVLLTPAGNKDEVSTRASVSYPFRNIGEIAVSSEKTIYIEDDVPDGKGVKDERAGSFLSRVVLRFDRRGKPQGYIGQEGLGGTPFPYIMGLYVTDKDQLVVICRQPTAWEAYWYSKDGTLMYQAEIDAKHLPTIKEKGLIASLVNIQPDLQDPVLYLMIYYYKETRDETTKAQSSIESVFSRVYKLNLKTKSYESSVELPLNPKRKEKVGFRTTEIASPPNELLGVSSNGFYFLLAFMDANVYALTVLDASGRVRERRLMVIEDSDLTYRSLELSSSGMVYGLLCDTSRAHISWWRSDLLLKGD